MVLAGSRAKFLGLSSERDFMRRTGQARVQACQVSKDVKWWALPDLNQRPIRYERTALTS